MQLLQNENIIMSSNGQKVVLTNIRVFIEDSKFGNSYKNYIFLENISSIEYVIKTYLWVLIVGIIILTLGAGYFSTNARFDEDEMLPCFGPGSLFILLYFLTIRRSISITPDGGNSINIDSTAITGQNVQNFIDKVQEAKLLRINQLYLSTTIPIKPSIQALKCSICQHTININDTFCESCGNKLK